MLAVFSFFLRKKSGLSDSIFITKFACELPIFSGDGESA